MYRVGFRWITRNWSPREAISYNTTRRYIKAMIAALADSESSFIVHVMALYPSNPSDIVSISGHSTSR